MNMMKITSVNENEKKKKNNNTTKKNQEETIQRKNNEETTMGKRQCENDKTEKKNMTIK